MTPSQPRRRAGAASPPAMKPATMCIDRRRLVALHIARVVASIALLVTGAIHLEQYVVAHFSVVPTVGPLFLLNFIAATSLGLVLLIPIRGSGRWGRVLLKSIAALAGIGVAAGALAALLISEQTPLFGFMEHGYRLEIVIAIAAEAVAILSLGVFLVLAESWPHTPGAKSDIRHEAGHTTSAPAATEA
jgi:hypothetical protein